VAQILTIFVGQCGNQVGSHLLRQICDEHSHTLHNISIEKIGIDRHPEDMEIFFRVYGDKIIPRILSLDMDPSTTGYLIDDIRKILEPYENLGLDTVNVLQGTGGCAKNWGVGNTMAEQHEEDIKTRLFELGASTASGIHFIHSAGGGTGSGFTSYIVRKLKTWFKEWNVTIPPRIITFSIISSSQDPVTTSPYNTILTLNTLREHADALVLFDNNALMGGMARLTQIPNFDYSEINPVIAKICSSISAPSRFPRRQGQNIDFVDIVSNLNIHKDAKMSVPSYFPLTKEEEESVISKQVNLNEMINIALDENHTFLTCPLENDKTIAMNIMGRGPWGMDEIGQAANLAGIEVNTPNIHHNVAGMPPNRAFGNVLILSTTKAETEPFTDIYERAMWLFDREYYLEYYEEQGYSKQFLKTELNSFNEMIESLRGLKT
jgi:cell division GTPase FtsZ